MSLVDLIIPPIVKKAILDKSYQWTMRDGSTIFVHEMGTDHLINTINHLRRKAARADRLSGCGLGGNYDPPYLDDDYVSDADGPGYYFPIYDLMIEELARRGIKYSQI